METESKGGECLICGSELCSSCNNFVHPDYGFVCWRKCAICGTPFPTWSVSSKMHCYNHSALDSFSDILRLEYDEDGTYIVGDNVTVAYGDGETPLGALRDYIVSLIEYSELLLKSQPVGEKLAVKAFVERVCEQAEKNMERTGKLEGSHYNAMLVELEKM